MGPLCHWLRGLSGHWVQEGVGVTRSPIGRCYGHQPERAQMVAGERAGPLGAMGRAQATGAQWGAGQGMAAGELERDEPGAAHHGARCSGATLGSSRGRQGRRARVGARDGAPCGACTARSAGAFSDKQAEGGWGACSRALKGRGRRGSLMPARERWGRAT